MLCHDLWQIFFPLRDRWEFLRHHILTPTQFWMRWKFYLTHTTFNIVFFYICATSLWPTLGHPLKLQTHPLSQWSVMCQHKPDAFLLVWILALLNVPPKSRTLMGSPWHTWLWWETLPSSVTPELAKEQGKDPLLELQSGWINFECNTLGEWQLWDGEAGFWWELPVRTAKFSQLIHVNQSKVCECVKVYYLISCIQVICYMYAAYMYIYVYMHLLSFALMYLYCSWPIMVDFL